MGEIKGVLFDLGDTLIVELDGPADIDTTSFEVLEGVEEMLAELKKHFKLAIVSNTFTWGDEEVAGALGRKGLMKYFDAVVTSVDAVSRKPDDGIFRRALGRPRVPSARGGDGRGPSGYRHRRSKQDGDD